MSVHRSSSGRVLRRREIRNCARPQVTKTEVLLSFHGSCIAFQLCIASSGTDHVAGVCGNYGPSSGFQLLIKLLETFCKLAVDTCHVQRITDRHLSLAGGVLHRRRGVPHACCRWQYHEESAPPAGSGHPNRVKGKDKIPCKHLDGNQLE
jgi:hypothetical protein